MRLPMCLHSTRFFRALCRARATSLALLLLLAMALVPAGPAQAQQTNGTFKPDELVGSGHKFFGNVSRGLALAIEEAVRRWGPRQQEKNHGR